MLRDQVRDSTKVSLDPRPPADDSQLAGLPGASASRDRLLLTAIRRVVSKPVLLSAALDRRSNNLDLIRLVAAWMVLYGHSFSVTPQAGAMDVLLQATGFPSAGLAVKIFFFMSGVLVTSSLLQKRSVVEFTVARLFRIWPGLIFVVLASAFVIGPFYTTLDLRTYFSSPGVYSYIRNQLLMNTWGTQGLGHFNLPGVFEANPYPGIVNASLWSLVVEVVAYIMLLTCFMVGLTSRTAAALLFAAVVIDAVAPTRLLFWFLPKGNEDFSNLPFCFAVGFIAAVFKDRIQVSIRLPVGFAILYWLFSGPDNARLLFYLFVFSLVLWLATHHFVLRLRLPADLSYGVFLWAFPIQQALAIHFVSWGILANQVMATALALVAAALSWTLVEKRAIRFGHRLGRVLSGKA